ncbi:MAG: PhnD/SsuA/transferrin family substrate-binding protein [Myxococcales bacterium]|nr:PhnD/SsuA/transferrin family substrate-binding protein [Myxococcales bacterium]
MTQLELATVQGANTVEVTAAIGALLDTRLGADVSVRVLPSDGHWEALRARLLAGTLDIGWICAATFAATLDADAPPPFELLAAPQWAGPCYHDAPCYFTDIVARAEHHATHIAALADARWVYNERGSLTGHLAVVDALDRGLAPDALESGSHPASVEALLDGRADVAAIDSTLYDYLRARRPELDQRLRVVCSLGPFASPPWIVSRRLPPALRTRLRDELCTLHEHAEGRAALAHGRLARFVAARADDYAAVAALIARAATLAPVLE